MDSENLLNQDDENLADPQPDDDDFSFDPNEEYLDFGDDAVQSVTTFDTPAGTISVVHDITLGDLIIATLLMGILIFQILKQLIRRF